ncbi:hypothetical protein O0L34_g13712 [Tuta absoluta]|nr:hypothetical protein O0L34_g13712 [Tuta absoluta]
MLLYHGQIDLNHRACSVFHPPYPPCGIPSSSLWCPPAMSFLAAFHRKLRNGDLLRERVFTLPPVEGVAGVELEPAAGAVSGGNGAGRGECVRVIQVDEEEKG